MSFGYDYSCTTLSQEGRIYQLEYAEKAIEAAPSSLGITCKDGIILLTEKIRQNKTLVKGSSPTIYSLANNIGIAVCGHLPDGRNIVSRAKQEVKSYYQNFGIEISAKILAERIALYVQTHTLYWSMRPFGAIVMISSFEKDSPHLFMIEGNGNCFEYYNCAQGKGRQFLKAEVEREIYDFRNKNCSDSLENALKILIKSYEGEKETEYELSVVSREQKGLHKIMKYDDLVSLVEKVKAEIKESDKKMQIDL